ncbi:RING-type domain-containing protein [Aphelenchoides bicaudatus]|nr:RING-type domain-containing protein [Aphelenchoides bicaudatus]
MADVPVDNTAQNNGVENTEETPAQDSNIRRSVRLRQKAQTRAALPVEESVQATTRQRLVPALTAMYRSASAASEVGSTISTVSNISSQTSSTQTITSSSRASSVETLNPFVVMQPFIDSSSDDSNPGTSSGTSSEPLNPLAPDFRLASALVEDDLGPPPARRRRIDTQPVTSSNNIQNDVQAEQTTSPNNNDNALIAESLGLTPEEYEQALRAEQQFNARNEQIHQDNIIANRLASNANAEPSIISCTSVPSTADRSRVSIPTISISAPTIISAPSTISGPSTVGAPSTSNTSSLLNVSSLSNVTIARPTGTKPDEVDMCAICFEEQPIDPFTCKFCRNIVGCFVCVKKWFSDARKNQQMQNCPLCRHHWTSTLFRKRAPRKPRNRASGSNNGPPPPCI